jgi:hypothetical protein
VERIARFTNLGHRWEVLEDAETIEFRPAHELDEDMRAVARTLENLSGTTATT